jgi:hypothetical protein
MRVQRSPGGDRVPARWAVCRRRPASSASGIFSAAVRSGHYDLAIVGMLSSVVSCSSLRVVDDYGRAHGGPAAPAIGAVPFRCAGGIDDRWFCLGILPRASSISPPHRSAPSSIDCARRLTIDRRSGRTFVRPVRLTCMGPSFSSATVSTDSSWPGPAAPCDEQTAQLLEQSIWRRSDSSMSCSVSRRSPPWRQREAKVRP